MARVLRKLRVDEISAVVRAANPDARVMIQKSAGDDLRDTLDEGIRRGVLRGGFPENTAAPRRAAPPSPHPPGRGAPRSTYKQETPAMSRSQELHFIAKQYGMATVCRHVLKHGPSGISEHEFVAMASAALPTTGFAKAFAAPDARGVMLRRTWEAIRDQQWLAKARARPQVASDDKLDGVEDGDREDMQAYGERSGGGGLASASGSRSEYDRLMAKAVELRKQFPGLSQAQAFARVYEHPSSRALAAAERRANRPRVG
jgi:hypothetical protein